MSENKKILKYCPNYYQIIEFNPLEDDELTQRIIRMYREYIFKVDLYNEEEINEVKELDAAVSKYINDYLFRREVQRQINNAKVERNCPDVIKFFIDLIVKIFANYEDYTTRVIYVSRWI